MNFLKTSLVLGSALAALIASPGFAASDDYYVGASIGYSNSNIDTNLAASGLNFSDSFDVKGADFGILTGARHTFDNRFFVGAETELSLSTASEDNMFGENISTDREYAVGIYFKPGYQFNDKFAAFATIGWQMASYEVEADGESGDDLYHGVAFGGGVEYSINERISIVGEYNRVALDSKTYSDSGISLRFDGDVDILKAAVKYHF